MEELCSFPEKTNAVGEEDCCRIHPGDAGPFLQFPQYAALAVQPVVVADQNGRIFLIQGDQAVIPQTLDKSLAVEEENANLPPR